MTGKTSRTVTAISPIATETFVMAGSASSKVHWKPLAGSIPRGNLIEGEVITEKLNVAVTDNTSVRLAFVFILDKIAKTVYDDMDESNECPIALRMLMPLISTALSGIRKTGALTKSNDRHVSLRKDANDRAGQSLQTASTVFDL
jgi:hypothetical protein